MGGGDGSGGGDDGGGGGGSDAGAGSAALSPTASFSLADCVSSSSRPASVLNLTTATEDTAPSIVAPSAVRLKTSQTGRQPAGGLLCFLLNRRPWNRARLPRSLASSPPSSEAALSGSGDGSSSGQPMPSSTSSTARLLDEVPRLSLLTPAVLVVSGTSSSSTSRVGRGRRARRDRDVCVSSSSSACTRVCLPEGMGGSAMRANLGPRSPRPCARRVPMPARRAPMPELMLGLPVAQVEVEAKPKPTLKPTPTARRHHALAPSPSALPSPSTYARARSARAAYM